MVNSFKFVLKRTSFLFFFLNGGVPAHVIQFSQENPHLLAEEDGSPFFYRGDTAWELFHRLNRGEASCYLQDRASKGFNLIQAEDLAELEGLNMPNAYGDVPLLQKDIHKPNEKYFEHVYYIIDKASDLGMYIGLLPC